MQGQLNAQQHQLDAIGQHASNHLKPEIPDTFSGDAFLKAETRRFSSCKFKTHLRGGRAGAAAHSAGRRRPHGGKREVWLTIVPHGRHEVALTRSPPGKCNGSWPELHLGKSTAKAQRSNFASPGGGQRRGGRGTHLRQMSLSWLYFAREDLQRGLDDAAAEAEDEVER
jgi:hypothetical protein